MPDESNIPIVPLRAYRQGTVLSARQLNTGVDATNKLIKTIESPRQIVRSAVPLSLTFCVLRELDVAAQTAQAQTLDYSEELVDKLPGEEDMGGHIIGVGDLFPVKPPPGMTWAMFNMTGGLRMLADAADPENLAGAPTLLVNSRNWAWWADSWIPNMEMLNPSEENSQGAGA